MQTKFTIPENDKPLSEKTLSQVITIQFTSFQNYPTPPPSNQPEGLYSLYNNLKTENNQLSYTQY